MPVKDFTAERDLRTVTAGRTDWSLVQAVDAVRLAHPVWQDTVLESLDLVTTTGDQLQADSMAEADQWLARRPSAALSSVFARWAPAGQIVAPGVPNRIAVRLERHSPTLWVGHTDDLGCAEMATRLTDALRAERARISPVGVSTRSGPPLDLPTASPAPPTRGPTTAVSDVQPTRAVTETGGGSGTEPITAMITWSHAGARQDHVLGLAQALRSNGIDVELDLYHQQEAVDWTRWGPRMIADVDFVLVVVSDGWREAWEGRGDPTRGAGAYAEASALRTLEAKNREDFLRKVRLVLLPDTTSGSIPDGLHGVPRHPLKEISDEGIRGLLRDLTGQAEHPKPPLGTVPILPPSVAPAPLQSAASIAASPPAAAAPAAGTTTAAPDPAAQPSALAHGPLPGPVGLAWRSTWDRSTSTEASITVHVVPVPAQMLPARALASVSATLPERLRRAQALDPTSGVDIQDDPDGVTLLFPPDARYLKGVRTGSPRGVRVNRSGQVSAWHTLPADNLGSIVDTAHMRTILTTCLRLIGITGMLPTDHVAIGAEMGPMIMVSRASVEELGQRSNATIAMSGPDQVQVDPDETVEVAALAGGAAEAANDLAAILARNWR